MRWLLITGKGVFSEFFAEQGKAKTEVQTPQFADKVWLINISVVNFLFMQCPSARTRIPLIAFNCEEL